MFTSRARTASTKLVGTVGRVGLVGKTVEDACIARRTQLSAMVDLGWNLLLLGAQHYAI